MSDEFTELYERSKNDRAPEAVVGSEVRYCINRIRALSSDLATAIKERDAAVAAGRVLAAKCVAWNDHESEALEFAVDPMDNGDITNHLALAWVKAAQEASDGQ